MLGRDGGMNGTWKIVVGGGGFILAAIGAAYGYGALAGDVKRNVESIGKNEADIERLEQLSRTALSNLARDSAVAATKIENIERGIAQMLSEIRKRK